MPRANRSTKNVPTKTQPANVIEQLSGVPAPTTDTETMPVLYPKMDTVEYSTTSKKGPLTAALWRQILNWETEKQYQERRMLAEPDSKPEHWIFGDTFHCRDTDGEKVRCWNNSDNRPFKLDWCIDLIHTILSGQWAGPATIPGETVNGETVRISKYGRVLSGQHQGTACILADEILSKERKRRAELADKGYEDNALNTKFLYNGRLLSSGPFWEGKKEVFIETIVIKGLSEDPRVLQSIDYVMPRTVADMLYTMELFRNNKQNERKELTKMLSAAIDMLWERTNTKGYKTHPEVVGFLERHGRLLKCVEHLFILNSSTAGRPISKVRINSGHAAAMCYLMGCSSDKTTDYSDEYRNEQPAPSERNLDWSLWERAQEFWTNMARSRDFDAVKQALGHLIESKPNDENNIGLGGRSHEKLAILSKAWEVFKSHPDHTGPVFPSDHDENGMEFYPDLCEGGALWLNYDKFDSNGKLLPDGQVELKDEADFGGIDYPSSLGSGGKQTKTNRHSPVDERPPTEKEIWGDRSTPGITEQLRKESAQRRSKK